ncbi:MAG TPA: GtrA family protein [Kiritimatiellia bacterium]|nr:GtrA family protein [Kiritimatiellia bacterium]
MFDRGKAGREVGHWLGFLGAGLPAFALALPLNFALVDGAGWPKPVAYAVVLIVQVTMNFFMCRWLVFKQAESSALLRQFVAFLAGIGGFRVLDWMVYALWVRMFPSYYLLIQVTNVILFSVMKYIYSKHVFRRREVST